MNVDRWRGVVTLEQAHALSKVCVEAGLLLREISLVKRHPAIGYDNWTDDLRETLVALGESLQVWADAGKPPEFDAVLSVRHLFQLRMDAFLAEHGRQEGGYSFEELS